MLCKLEHELNTDAGVPSPEDFLEIWKALRGVFWELCSHDINPSWGSKMNYAKALEGVYAQLNRIAESLASEQKGSDDDGSSNTTSR